jgi:hypothetical protein
MFRVDNIKTVRGSDGEGYYYIGRKGWGRLGSNLANPYHIGRDGTRDEVIAKYREWLQGVLDSKKGYAYEEFISLFNRYRAGENITLLCYCYPLPCHGDVLLEALEKFVMNQSEYLVKQLEEMVTLAKSGKISSVLAIAITSEGEIERFGAVSKDDFCIAVEGLESTFVTKYML